MKGHVAATDGNERPWRKGFEGGMTADKYQKITKTAKVPAARFGVAFLIRSCWIDCEGFSLLTTDRQIGR